MNCLNDKIDLAPLLRLTEQTDLPLGLEVTERIRAAAAVFHEDEGGCHGLDHSFRVHTTALQIGRQMNARLDILSAASLLHDIGRRDESKSKGQVCHAAKGAELARPILTGIGFKGVDIEKISHCISTHRFRDENLPGSPEAKILFDADKLDSIGAIGIGRAFLFAGQVGARLHNHDIDIHSTDPYTIEDTAYREFRVKLGRIKDRMQTPMGRRLANERHKFMVDFFSRLETEINGQAEDG
jgi:uncharacterized protein